MRVRVPVAECQPRTFFLLAGPSKKTQDTSGIRAHAVIPNRVVIAILSAATVCKNVKFATGPKIPTVLWSTSGMWSLMPEGTACPG